MRLFLDVDWWGMWECMPLVGIDGGVFIVGTEGEQSHGRFGTKGIRSLDG